jgi:hypothetical protein
MPSFPVPLNTDQIFNKVTSLLSNGLRTQLRIDTAIKYLLIAQNLKALFLVKR